MFWRVMWLVLWCGVLGCGDEVVDDVQDLRQITTRFDETGQTEAIDIAPFDGDVLWLSVHAEPQTCLALTSLVDDQSRQWIGQRSFGSSCRDCDLRTSVIRGHGVVSLPTFGGFSPAGGLTARLGLVNCQTLTPMTHHDAKQTVSISWRTGRLPKAGQLRVRLVTSSYSMFHEQPEQQKALQAQVAKRFEGTGLSLLWVSGQTLGQIPETVEFSHADHQALSEHHAQVEASAKTIDVVLMGCLYYRDPFFGARNAVDGYTTRVGASGVDAIYMPGRRCGSFGDAPTPWPLDHYGQILAHELGHFLGLYHVVERDGVEDQLADTTHNNLMHHNPSLRTSVGLTPEQSVIMRAHPWVEPLDMR